MLKKAIIIFRTRGLSGLLRAATSRIRGLLAGRARSFSIYKNQFIDKAGIEIGGPSQVFSKRGIFPVYPIVGNLDNCNFSITTVWEGDITQGDTYRFDKKKPAGQQYIVEASALEALSSDAYDFLLSSHMLEHAANPILALSEWYRLLKNGGTLVLILPNRKFTFDNRRPITTIEHLVSDFNAEMTEDDLTHLPEILALHDLERDPEVRDIAAFKSRAMHNFENRCLHHHVFDIQLAIKLVEFTGFTLQTFEEIAPHHLLVVAQKLSKQFDD